MKFRVLAAALLLAACADHSDRSPASTHTCVTAPTGLVECHEKP